MADALERLLSVGRVDLVVLPSVSPFLALDIVRGARHEVVLSRGIGACRTGGARGYIPEQPPS